MNYIIGHELPSDVPGKTWKEKNMEMQHIYPIGSLVEIVDTGARLFVVKHERDCDGTPLYSLHADYEEYLEWLQNEYYCKHHAGYSEDSLRLISEK